MKKDDDDGHLAWRVATTGRNATVSESQDLWWTPLELAADEPADGYALTGDDDLVTFGFTAPALAAKPMVVFSTTGDFSDKKHLVRLKVHKGDTQVTLTSRTLGSLQRKDDGDGVVVWRVEDAASRKTTVGPCQERELILPQ